MNSSNKIIFSEIEKKIADGSELTKYELSAKSWINLMNLATEEYISNGKLISEKLKLWRKIFLDRFVLNKATNWKVEALKSRNIYQYVICGVLKKANFDDIFLVESNVWSLKEPTHLVGDDKTWALFFIGFANGDGVDKARIEDWVIENSKVIKTNKLPAWKIDCLSKFNFTDILENTVNEITELSIRIELGEQSLFGKLNRRQKEAKSWLNFLAEFESYEGNFDLLRKKCSREMKVWLWNNCLRRVKNTHPDWKSRMLERAEFNLYCDKYFLNFGVYIPKLIAYKKKHDKFNVVNTKINEKLYRWCVDIVRKNEPDYISYLADLVGMTDIEKESFTSSMVESRWSIQSGEGISDSRHNQRHAELSKRFSEMTSKQAMGVLRRLSRVQVLDAQEIELLHWVEIIKTIFVDISHIGEHDVFKFTKNDDEVAFIKRLIKDYTKPGLYGWKKRFIEEYGLEKFSADSRVLSRHELNIEKLRKFFDDYGHIFVTGEFGDDWKKISTWRRSISYPMKKINRSSWPGTKRYIEIKSLFPSLSDEDVSKFFIL